VAPFVPWFVIKSMRLSVSARMLVAYTWGMRTWGVRYPNGVVSRCGSLCPTVRNKEHAVALFGTDAGCVRARGNGDAGVRYTNSGG
jgi:hypothetical protein